MNNLPYSQEFYIEDMVKKSGCYQIYLNSNSIGYFLVTLDKVLVEFYLDKKEMRQSQYIFKLLIEKEYYASKKTLEKAGFITSHRIVRFEFQNI